MSLVSIFSRLAEENLNSIINKLGELSSNSTELTMAVMEIASTPSDPRDYRILMRCV